jgi:phosphoglycerate dehydrogenase-like enzyme
MAKTDGISRIGGLFILDPPTLDLVYGPQEQRAILRHVKMIAPPQTRESIAQNPDLLESAQVIFSGWTPPRFDDAFFDKAPNLKAIFYAAGRLNLADSARQRGIVATTAHDANSIPVAEYTLATLLFSLKHGWQLSRQTRQQRRFVARDGAPGCYGATVGLISLGTIARILLKLLAPFELNVLVYDPFMSAAEAAELNVEKVSLDELFRRSDVVSLHTPFYPETRGMIRGNHLASMKSGATFINTARGAIVRQDEMIDVAIGRPDLQFVLDVTDPDSPTADSALYDLANVLLTPHIAGSVGGECRRMGQYMVEELERYMRGEPLKWAVQPQSPPERCTVRQMTRRPTDFLSQPVV